MNVKRFNLIAVMLIFSCFSQVEQPEKLQTQLPALELNNISEIDAITQVLSFAKLPGGVVRMMNCEETPRHSFNVNGMSVSEALDYIASFDRVTSWKLQDGVINVVPTAGIPELLKIQLDVFAAKDGRLLANAVSGMLFSNPKVRARASEIGLTRAPQFGGLSSSDEPIIHIELHDVTVQQVLNNIALKHGSGVWRYSENHCQQKNEFQIDWAVH